MLPARKESESETKHKQRQKHRQGIQRPNESRKTKQQASAEETPDAQHCGF